MSWHRVRIFLALSFTSLASIAQMAYAGDADPATAAAPAAPASVSPAPDGGGDVALDAITVSARKREERLQDVPLSITSLSGTALQNDGDYTIQDLSDKAPGLYIAPSNPRQTSIQIRALGKNSANDGLETSVGVYVDGVYLAQPGEATFDLNDLDHVEVLRGPQGTLFGKNNTAGAVSFYTRKPSLTSSAEAELVGGNDGTYEFHASATGPVADKTAFRLTAYDKSRDGFFTNLYDGNRYDGFDRKGVRGQLLNESFGDVSVRLIAEHYESKELFANTVLVEPFPGYANGVAYTKSLEKVGAALGYTPVFSPWSRLVDLNSARPIVTNQTAYSSQVTWKLGDYTLDSISAFRRYVFDAKNDGDSTPLDIVDWSGTVSSNRHWSEELRLSSPLGGPVDYVAGLYYYHLSLWTNSPTQFGSLASSYYGTASTAPGALDGVLQNTIGTPDTNSVAAFAQANYHLAREWTLTGGLRETHESKSATIANTLVGGADPSSLSAADLAVRESQTVTGTVSTGFTANALSWLASLSHPLSDDSTAFLTASKGFKSGGINVEVTSGVPLVIAPETAIDIETGAKGSGLDGRLQYDADLYWSKISNYQGNFQSANPLLGQYLANVGDVRVRGTEAEASLRPIDRLRLSAHAAFNDATYLDFTNAPCPTELANIYKVCNFSGFTLPYAPRWTGNVGAETRQPLAPGFVLYVGADVTAHSSENVNSGLSEYGVQSAYTLTNAHIGFTGRDGAYDLSFWVKNLFDAQYYTSRGPSSILGVKVITGTPGDPRTLGVTLRVYL
jgi:iron complex outermembrane receptor protein